MYRIDHTHLLKYTIYILMQLISCSVLLQTKVSYSTLIIKIRKVKKWKQKIMQIVVQILEIEERPLFIISFSYHIYHIYHHGSAQIEPINVGIFSVDFMWQKHILQHFEKTFVFCGSLCISHNYIGSATPPPVSLSKYFVIHLSMWILLTSPVRPKIFWNVFFQNMSSKHYQWRGTFTVRIPSKIFIFLPLLQSEWCQKELL